ncbi:hypothetical protein [Pseudoxanthomonas japonensis]|uniref:hypothetical protein n=1 Tax=Pseudoxanthomonas japonensis TaxID=69284 RepID=UPI003748FD4F
MKERDVSSLRRKHRQKEVAVLNLTRNSSEKEVWDELIRVIEALFEHFNVAKENPFQLILEMGLDAGYLRPALIKRAPGARPHWSVRSSVRLWTTVEVLLVKHRKFAAKWGVKNAIELIEVGIAEGKKEWPYNEWPAETGLRAQYYRARKLPEVRALMKLAKLPPEIWLDTFEQMSLTP